MVVEFEASGKASPCARIGDMGNVGYVVAKDLEIEHGKRWIENVECNQ